MFLLAIGENKKVIFLECHNNFLEVIHVCGLSLQLVLALLRVFLPVFLIPT